MIPKFFFIYHALIIVSLSLVTVSRRNPVHAVLFMLVIFLFGAFCALWAQNTGRSAWLWFFLGIIFSVLTVIFLLSKNASDRDSRGPASSPN